MQIFSISRIYQQRWKNCSCGMNLTHKEITYELTIGDKGSEVISHPHSIVSLVF
jgi:hypothetical protein